MAAPCVSKHFICSKTQLCIDTVLVAGQSFRWKKNNSGEWLGVMAGLVWRLKQTDDRILYQVYGPESLSASSFNNKTGFQKATEGGYGKDIDLKYVPGMFELKQEASSLAEYCNTNVDSAIKLEPSQDCEGMNFINSVINKTDSHVYKSTGCKRKKQQSKKAVIVKRDKQNTNDQTEPNPVRASTRNKLSGLKKLQTGEQCLEQAPVAKHISQTSSVNMKHVMEDVHYHLLHDYFQLGVDLESLYSHWSSEDPHFEKVGEHFRGVRLLRLDPTECLLSFVCSSNNHISRISSMVEKLCTYYGKHIASVDGVDYYTFPHLSALCGDNVDSHLRELGFGYRAKFIASIAKYVAQEKEEGWLDSLRKRSYSEAKAELLTLLGVGAKVADCVCLMSLDKPEALPVDTHVWQITLKNYMAKLHSAKSLTETLYSEIGDFYRNLWGPYAGWAQAVLFAADLRHNKQRGQGQSEIKTDGDGSTTLQKSKCKRKQEEKPTKGRKKNK